MPCDSRITIKIKTLADVKDAAKKLKHSVTEHGSTGLTVKTQAGESLSFTQYGQGGVTVAASAARNQGRDLLKALTIQYAETGIRKFAAKKGYTVSREQGKPRQFILTRYK